MSTVLSRMIPLLTRRWRVVMPLIAAGGIAAFVVPITLLGGQTHSTAIRIGIAPSPGAQHPPGAKLSTRQPAPTRRSIGGNVTEVMNNGSVTVCSLITGTEVNQVMKQRLPAPVPVAVGSYDECSTSARSVAPSTASPVRVAWAVPPQPEPALSFRQMTINLPSSDAVPGLGQSAYCNSQGGASSELYVLGSGHFLEVFADTCYHAIDLARIALTGL